jgi:glycosyltransferase involved in cell wall biosynthesis
MAQTLDGGGVERAMLRMARGWTARGARVTLAIGDASGPLSAELPPAAATIVAGKRGYRAMLAGMPALVAQTKPDVVFVPGNHYTAVAAAIRLHLGEKAPPIVVKVSNALVRRDQGVVARTAYARWLRLHPRFVDAVVAMSPAMAREAAAAMGLPVADIAVIANPPAEHSGTAGPALPPRYLIGVGRLAPQKRWDRAVAALPHLADPAVPLVLLGEGPERPALERQAAALGVADRLILPGHVADPMPAIAGATALILTSDFEGVPGAIGEALSLGTPVVTTRSSVAIDELVTGPADGTVVPHDDNAALVAAIDHWLTLGRPRPAPRTVEGDPIGAYLALFRSLVSSSSRAS